LDLLTVFYKMVMESQKEFSSTLCTSASVTVIAASLGTAKCDDGKKPSHSIWTKGRKTQLNLPWN